MIHHHSYTVRVMIPAEEKQRLDEFATIWKGRFIFSALHLANGKTEVCYSFLNEDNKEQFVKQLSLLHNATII